MNRTQDDATQDTQTTGDKRQQATFDLASGRVVVTQAEFVRIRDAVVAFLKNSEHESRDELVQELEDAAPFFNENGAGRIGFWQLTQRGDELRLLRQQFPRAPVMIFHYAVLAYDGKTWKVVRFGYERVRGR